jgi:hypothetical protein
MTISSRPRFLLAFSLAPLLAAILFVIGDQLQTHRFGVFNPNLYYRYFVYFVTAVPVSYAVSIVIGGPGVLLLRELRWLTPATVVTGAMLIGISLPLLLIRRWTWWALEDILSLLAWGMIIGMSGGIPFGWLLFPISGFRFLKCVTLGLALTACAGFAFCFLFDSEGMPVGKFACGRHAPLFLYPLWIISIVTLSFIPRFAFRDRRPS